MELTNQQFEELRKLRARRGMECTCHLNPPCSTCVDPITKEEAEELDIPFKE